MLLGFGIVCVALISGYALFFKGRQRHYGEQPISSFTLFALLFTAGLDGGLIILPLTEFAQYADTVTHPEYAFSNPLAIEFGFWAFLVWLIYFASCFYFCFFEPHLRFFEIPIVKWIHNVLIAFTCAFSAALLFNSLPWYFPQWAQATYFSVFSIGLMITIIFTSVFFSSKFSHVKQLGRLSFIAFILLTGSMAIYSQCDRHALNEYLPLIGDYFLNMEHFIFPLGDYHEFYLFWWFAWSIMIGQFVAQHVNGQQTWQLLVMFLVVPAIPIAIWFMVLYHFYMHDILAHPFFLQAMAWVGILFVINSLDTLIRLYSSNLNLTAEQLGQKSYVLLHATIMMLLTAMFSFGYIEIHHIGGAVIVLFGAMCIFGFNKYFKALQARGN